MDFDLGQAVEDTAAKLEERGPGAEHPPAFQGFFRQAPARGELARAEQFGGWQGDRSWADSRSVGGALGGPQWGSVTPDERDSSRCSPVRQCRAQRQTPQPLAWVRSASSFHAVSFPDTRACAPARVGLRQTAFARCALIDQTSLWQRPFRQCETVAATGCAGHRRRDRTAGAVAGLHRRDRPGGSGTAPGGVLTGAGAVRDQDSVGGPGGGQYRAGCRSFGPLRGVYLSFCLPQRVHRPVSTTGVNR